MVKAFKNLKKKCLSIFKNLQVKGNADAIRQLGMIYVNVEYVKKDEFKGIQLIRYR